MYKVNFLELLPYDTSKPVLSFASNIFEESLFFLGARNIQ